MRNVSVVAESAILRARSLRTLRSGGVERDHLVTGVQDGPVSLYAGIK